MKSVRLAVSIAVVLVVVGGYAGSQYAYLLGSDAAADFEVKLNDPRVHVLMLVVLLATIALAFVTDRKENAP